MLVLWKTRMVLISFLALALGVFAAGAVVYGFLS